MHLVSPGLWAEGCWNIQEPSSQWNTENKGIEILFLVVQLALFSHCSVEKLYGEAYMILALPEESGLQSIYTDEDLSVWISGSWHTVDG